MGNQDKRFFLTPDNQRQFTALENTTFVNQFSYFDEESLGLNFPDLYIASGQSFGFWPNTKRYDGGSHDIDQVFDENFYTDLGQMSPNFVLTGDFNGSGRTDFVLLSDNTIKYLKNDGGRTFSEVTLSNLQDAYLSSDVVPDLTPIFAKFADINSDGFGDLVVCEKFTNSQGK